MPVIRTGYLLGILGPLVTAGGCHWRSGALVFLGFGLCGAAQSIVLLSRAAAAEMFPPGRRARGMSTVLFAVVSGAIWGPLVFGPMFSGRRFTAGRLTLPWLCAGLFTTAGLAISFGVRRDPRDISRAFVDGASAAPLRALLGRPGVTTAMVAAVSSFAVMAGVMNLAGYVAVGHCMFGLGLGWCLAYIAATTEFVNLTLPAGRGRLVGGVVYTGAGGSVPLAGVATGVALLACAWVAGNGLGQLEPVAVD